MIITTRIQAIANSIPVSQCLLVVLIPSNDFVVPNKSRFSPKPAASQSARGFSQSRPAEKLDGPNDFLRTSPPSKALPLPPHPPSTLGPCGFCACSLPLAILLTGGLLFSVSMLARTVLRSVPSRGLARQLLNRPSAVSTPPPLCQLRTPGNGSIGLQWV